MKKQQNNSARASALQITLSLALILIWVVLMASTFTAAPELPEVVAAIRLPGVEQLGQLATARPLSAIRLWGLT